MSLLNVPYQSHKPLRISIHGVKQYLKELWISFLCDFGVDAIILQRMCLDLGYTVEPACKISITPGHIVSDITFSFQMMTHIAFQIARQPLGMASLTEYNNPNATHTLNILKPTSAHATHSNIPACHQLLADTNLTISISPHKFGMEQIRRVLDMDHEPYGTNRQITDAIVNAYLLLIREEYEALRGTRPEIPDFAIAGTLVTDAMSSEPVSNNFKPHEKKKYWFPKVLLRMPFLCTY